MKSKKASPSISIVESSVAQTESSSIDSATAKPAQGDIAVIYEYHDLVAAGELAYGPAVAKGLIESNPAKLFVDFYSLLPNHHTFVLRERSNVVGTVSLIIDSAAGLPSDAYVYNVNRYLRVENRLLGEIRALAVQGNPMISQERRVRILNAVLLYAARVAKCELLNVVVTPGEKLFFDHYLTDIGSNYHSRKSEESESELITIDLQSVFGKEKWWHNDQYVPDPNALTSPLLIAPVLTFDVVREILHGRTKVCKLLTDSHWQLLKSAYEPYFDLSPLCPEMIAPLPIQRAFRYMTNFRAILRTRSKMVLGQVFDVSTSGIFFKTEEELEVGSTIQIYFQINGQTWSLPMKVRRLQRPHQSRYPGGYGLEIEARDGSLMQLLKKAHARESGMMMAS